MDDIEMMIQTEAGARKLLAEIKYPNGKFLCTECGHTEAYEIKSYDLLECKNRSCRKQTSLTAGTIFHNLKLPVHKYFRVILDIASGAGICAHQHSKALGISATTAWRWHQKIRVALERSDTDDESILVDRELLEQVLFRRSVESQPKNGSHFAHTAETIEIDFTHRSCTENRSVARTIDFIASIYNGVAEKYAQLYTAEYKYVVTQAHKGFKHLLAILVRAGPVSGDEIESYSSPKFIRIPAFA